MTISAFQYYNTTRRIGLIRYNVTAITWCRTIFEIGSFDTINDVLSTFHIYIDENMNLEISHFKSVQINEYSKHVVIKSYYPYSKHYYQCNMHIQTSTSVSIQPDLQEKII